MQVNVFITRQDGALQNSLLVLPMAPTAAIPKEYRQGWRYFATTNTSDRMLGDDATALEAEIARAGFAIVEVKAPEH